MARLKPAARSCEADARPGLGLCPEQKAAQGGNQAKILRVSMPFEKGRIPQRNCRQDLLEDGQRKQTPPNPWDTVH
jgi:hypothetical protein